jgi:hypothetical protein
MKTKYKAGSKFKLTADALENYGAQYADKAFTVTSVSTAYMPAEEFYRRGKPEGFHPGFDSSAGCALYDA